VSLDYPVRLLTVLWDVRWLVLLSCMSGLGLWVSEIAYAFCVVDVIPQVPTRPFTFTKLLSSWIG
jgi:hypothetical protein